MKTTFDAKGTLLIKAEDNTEAYALNALALNLQAKGIYTEWVIFDMNVEPEQEQELAWIPGAAQHPGGANLFVGKACNTDLKNQGVSYPRTCARCGKGPCHNSGRDGY
jgi:hypothetical protein